MSTDVLPAGPEVCPTCRELFDVLMRKGVVEDIGAAVDTAHMNGPWCGVLFANLSRMPAAASRQAHKIDRAQRLGYYLDNRSLDELKELARANQSHEDSAEVLECFDFLLRGREVAVLFVWKGCIACLWATAMPQDDNDDHCDRREHHRPPVLTEAWLREKLLGPKKPVVQTSQQNNPAKLAATAPVVENPHQHHPGKVASSPSGAVKPADTTPAMDRSPSKREKPALDLRLVRMVLRVAPELQEDLIGISDRLFDETRLEYSYAAIIRGLITLGLAAIVGKASLAVEFAGARVPRGRKRGSPWNRREREDE